MELIFGWRPEVAFLASMPAPAAMAPVGEIVAKMAGALGLGPSTAWFGYLVDADDPKAAGEALRWHIPAMRPRFLVALGQFAGGALGSAAVGTWFEFEGVPGLVTYHPAQLLQDAQLKGMAWEHLKLLRRRLASATAGA